MLVFMIMKTNFRLVVAAIWMLTVSCSTTKTVQPGKTNAAALSDSILVDKDGNRYPLKVMSDHNLWMTVNLKLNIPGSYCYENADSNCNKYGRLYTWEAAKQGCSLLGEEWQLPAKNDWLQLTHLYGASAGDSNAIRKEAFSALMYTGASGFNAVLGGGRAADEGYKRGEAHGFYWTATENDSSIASYANFAKGSQALYMQNEGEKDRAFSVRCVKRMNASK